MRLSTIRLSLPVCLFIAVAALTLTNGGTAWAQTTQPADEDATKGAPASTQPADDEAQEEDPSDDDPNPPMPGFNAADSDAKAIAIADEVMQAMGGRKAWDQTRHVSWNFFGARRLIWDKHTGMVRVMSGDPSQPEKGSVTMVDIHRLTGRAFTDGQEITDPQALKGRLRSAQRQWINDAYWLVMPYKLKDSGVTLTYVGQEATRDGRQADKLHLTFEKVGATPQNAYDAWVDKETRLVTQWAFYSNAKNDKPNFVNPWANWTTHGAILLSGDRGGRKLTDIQVFDELPATVYTELAAPKLH